MRSERHGLVFSFWGELGSWSGVSCAHEVLSQRSSEVPEEQCQPFPLTVLSDL